MIKIMILICQVSINGLSIVFHPFAGFMKFRYVCCMEKIALFASGNGTNAQRIMEYFSNHPVVSVGRILTNNPGANVIRRAGAFNVPVTVFNRTQFMESTDILKVLIDDGIGFIVLAGFLWMIPGYLLKAYPGRIINIHPALLPKYGGKGMFGMAVHKAVLAANEPRSGISIHFVNDKYDDGAIIFQAECDISPGETPESLAQKVHTLEYEYYPVVIEALAVEEEEED